MGTMECVQKENRWDTEIFGVIVLSTATKFDKIKHDLEDAELSYVQIAQIQVVLQKKLNENDKKLNERENAIME